MWSLHHLIEIICIVKETNFKSNDESNPKSESVMVGRSNEVLCWDLTRLFNFLRAHTIEWLEGILFFFLSTFLFCWICELLDFSKLGCQRHSCMWMRMWMYIYVCVCVFGAKAIVVALFKMASFRLSRAK